MRKKQTTTIVLILAAIAAYWFFVKRKQGAPAALPAPEAVASQTQPPFIVPGG